MGTRRTPFSEEGWSGLSGIEAWRYEYDVIRFLILGKFLTECEHVPYCRQSAKEKKKPRL
jgi:hypothetical protein